MRNVFTLGLTIALSGCQLAAVPRINAADQLVAGQVAEALGQIEKLRPEAGDTFDFVLVGDSRGGLDVLKREVAEIDRLNPAFVIYTGDLVGEGTEQEYKDGLAVLKALRAPVVPTVGNHERANGGLQYYYKYFGKELDYSFDYGSWRFASVDNSTGGLTDGQIDWLDATLTGARHKVVFAHMPPPLGIWFVHPFRGNYKKFMGVAERQKVDACLFGHIHLFDKAEKRGVRYMVSGGGGAPLYRLPLYNSREGGAFYHYVICHASPSGLTYEVRKVGGFTPRWDDEPAETDDPGETVNDF